MVMAKFAALGVPAPLAGLAREGRGDEPPEQRTRFLDASLQHVIVGKPEAAGEEGPRARRQVIGGRAGVVSQHEAVPQKMLLDRRDGPHHPRVGGGRNPTMAIISRLASHCSDP